MSEKNEKSGKKTIAIIERLKKVKHIEIIIAVLFIAILLVIYFVSFSNKKSGTSGNGEVDYSTVYSGSYAEENEKKLKTLVEGIAGVGSCGVMINYESTAEKVIAYIENTTENFTGDEKTNSTTNKSPSIISSGGSQLPIILKEIAPKVVGILIVAQGAGNITVRLSIINAVSVLFGISTDKIAVLEKA